MLIIRSIYCILNYTRVEVWSLTLSFSDSLVLLLNLKLDDEQMICIQLWLAGAGLGVSTGG